jgi:hypothetical protein
MKTVCVLGGYGIFGSRIARALSETPGLAVRVAGRDRERGESFARSIGARFHHVSAERAASLAECLEACDLVIDAAGPFQERDYAVARECIGRGAHYLDLADAREFVCGIEALDAEARARGVFVGSGASSVPAITWALVAELAAEFASIEGIEIALSPGNQNPRGAATIRAILGQLGRPMRVWIDGAWRVLHGWGGARLREFPPDVGLRRIFDCEVPDLDLFPAAWRARTVRFGAGLEFEPFNRMLALLARMRRMHLLPPLERLAPLALRVSLRFFGRGSKNGSLAVWMTGRGTDGAELARAIALVTADDGPATPSAAAILLARKLLLGAGIAPGARSCAGTLTLDEIHAHLAPLGIWCARTDQRGAWSEPPTGATGTPLRA